MLDWDRDMLVLRGGGCECEKSESTLKIETRTRRHSLVNGS